MNNANQPKGICLGDETEWVVDGFSDLELFFRNLPGLLSGQEAILYFEGVSISSDVREFMAKHSVSGWHDIRRGTIWPEPLIFHLPATPEILDGLADLAFRHAYSEIADHCHVYNRKQMILQWYDACDAGCPFGVSSDISEKDLKIFCKATGANYKPHVKK